MEQGHLTANDKVNQFIDGWQLENPFSTTVEVGHLLTHSAGFNERVTGYMARSNRDVEELGPHLSHRMPAVGHRPGQFVNYSNYGYGLAGLLVEKVSGLPFDEYVQQHILQMIQVLCLNY